MVTEPQEIHPKVSTIREKELLGQLRAVTGYLGELMQGVQNTGKVQLLSPSLKKGERRIDLPA